MEAQAKVEEKEMDMGEVISVYTRRQAIEDGELVDISETSEAIEAGFKIPVCVTRALWGKIDGYKEDGQVKNGRLWDVCYLALIQFRKDRQAGKDCHIVEFRVKFYEDKYPTAFYLVFNEFEGFTIMHPEDY